MYWSVVVILSPLLSIFFEKSKNTRNELARPVIGTIFQSKQKSAHYIEIVVHILFQVFPLLFCFYDSSVSVTHNQPNISILCSKCFLSNSFH